MASSRNWQRNPYIIGIPIKEARFFFGREELFNFITDNLSSRAKVIILFGQRRIGKSSVLHQIPNFVHLEEFVFVQFDLQDQAWQRLGGILSDLAADIADSLNAKLQRKLTPPSSQELEKDPDLFTSAFLPQVYEALEGKNLVLLLDEFDALGDAEGASVSPFVRFLQSIIYRQEKLFIIPVLGRRLKEVPLLISLFKEAPSQEIGLLDENSATKLITEPAKDVLSYPHEAIKAILNLSSGHPYFTQLICHVLFARMREEGRATVTPADVEAIVDKAIESGEAGLAWFRDGLPVPERVVFSAAAATQDVLLHAQTGKAPKKLTSITFDLFKIGASGGLLWAMLEHCGIKQTEQLRKAEERLIRWGYLRELARSKILGLELYTYEVTIELVRLWLLKRHPLREAMRDLERLDPEANELYEKAVAARQQKESPASAELLGLYEAILKANPNHFSALFEMAQLCLEEKRFEQAEELYERAYKINNIRSREGLVESLLGQGHKLMAQGEFQPAKEKFKKVLEIDPNEPSAQQALNEVEDKIRRAKAVRNPFNAVGPVPPDQFVGRQREVDIIFSHMLQGGNVAVYGERRIGKTSLLRYVASPDIRSKHGAELTRALTLYIDCQSIMPFSPARFWQEVLLEIRELVADDEELISITDNLLKADRIRVRDLRKLLQAINSRERLIVLLIDEFENALQPNDTYPEAEMVAFIYELRGLSSLEGVSLPVVVATQRRLNESGPLPTSHASPWFNVYQLLPLRPFDDAEFAELLAKMPGEFELGSEESNWLRQVADRHPYLLQLSLSILFRLHAENKGFDLKQVTQEMAITTESFFLTIWSGATLVERLVLTKIALDGYEARTGKPLLNLSDDYIFTDYQRELRRLEDRRLVLRNALDGQERYCLISCLMEWWIIKEIEARRAEDAEEAQLLSQLPPDYAEQLRKIFQEIRSNQLAFHSVEAWARPQKGVEDYGAT